jgi:uncharacterized protein (UPF0332 family)
MDNKKVLWCFKIKDGIKIVEPNERIAKTYLEQAKLSLLRAKKNFEDKDLLWTTVTLYYAEYYAVYAFLQRIGIKCENHMCSIEVTGTLLGKEKINNIIEHKEKRIDAQYYMKTGLEIQVQEMLLAAQEMVVWFDDFISNISEQEIIKYKEEILLLTRNS